jgi:hypothetical protein
MTATIMIKATALAYYARLRRTTASPLLRHVCERALRFEPPHLRFQWVRLDAAQSRRPAWLQTIVIAGRHVLFLAVVLAVWADHRRLLKAAGHSPRSFWSEARRQMGRIRRTPPDAAPSRRRTTITVPPARRQAADAARLPREAPSRMQGWLH